MANMKAKIYNERVKQFASTINTLSIAVFILAFVRPQFDESPSEVPPFWDVPKAAIIVPWSGVSAEKSDLVGLTLVNLEPNLNFWWAGLALASYAVAMAVLGLLIDER
ncbi:MAG: hypothetical protein AAFR21_14595 [Pseudomonadota bacterium]